MYPEREPIGITMAPSMGLRVCSSMTLPLSRTRSCPVGSSCASVSRAEPNSTSNRMPKRAVLSAAVDLGVARTKSLVRERGRALSGPVERPAGARS